MTTPQPSPPKPLGKGEIPMPAEGLDLSTGKKGLTEAWKRLSLGKLSKEQEEVELRLWRPKNKERSTSNPGYRMSLGEGKLGPKDPC